MQIVLSHCLYTCVSGSISQNMEILFYYQCRNNHFDTFINQISELRFVLSCDIRTKTKVEDIKHNLIIQNASHILIVKPGQFQSKEYISGVEA